MDVKERIKKQIKDVSEQLTELELYAIEMDEMLLNIETQQEEERKINGITRDQIIEVKMTRDIIDLRTEALKVQLDILKSNFKKL